MVRVSFPTIVLSADELKLVKRCVEGRDDAEDVLGNEDSGREMDTVDESISRPENLVGQGSLSEAECRYSACEWRGGGDVDV